MAPRLDTLVVDDVAFDVRWSRRRRTIGISIPREGAPRLAAPVGCRRATLEIAVRAKLPWVRRKLGERAALAQLAAPRRYETGERFPYLGHDYRLVLLDDTPGADGVSGDDGAPARNGRDKDVQLVLLDDGNDAAGGAATAGQGDRGQSEVVQDGAGKSAPGLALRRGRFELPSSLSGQGRECFEAWYRARAADVLVARVAHFAPLFGVGPPVVRIKDMRTRWGSCSSHGRISLHWGLVLLSRDVLDYVVVHELAHLREMNHGARFWRGVEEILPDYRERRARLKATGRAVR
jgi:predicted metal-dependent hydrolase